MKKFLGKRTLLAISAALFLAGGLAIITAVPSTAQYYGPIAAFWGLLLTLFILGTFYLELVSIRKALKSSRVVERLTKELRAETIVSRKQLDTTSAKIADIAGSVGRTAPLIRDLHKSIEHLASNQTQISIGNKGSQNYDNPAPETGPNADPSQVETLDSESHRFTNTHQVHLIDPTLSIPHWEVSKSGANFDIQVANNEAISLELTSATVSSLTDAMMSSILCAVAFDKDGNHLDHQVLKSAHEEFGSFSFIHSVNTHKQVFKLSLPAAAASIKISILPWEDNQKLSNQVTILRRSPNINWVKTRHVSQIKVATILDEFSFNSFSPEFTAVPITPNNWLNKFEKEKPDLFFCESAWSGENTVLRPWKGKIYASTNFSKENRTTLLEILDYCALNRIPTVFWNKEDPTHYTDRKHDFVKTAILFDHIFTTDNESAKQYQTDYGHTSVNVLPFAVQPQLFNPIATSQRSNNLVFAGSWYANHIERSENMEKMFEAAISSGHKLKIYDRYYYDDDPLHVFPKKYQEFLVPPVPHNEVSKVYKESTIGMTINTVTTSETMFARRIFELMACNTLVVSNYSVGVEKLFGSDVLFLDQKNDALMDLDQSRINELRDRNTRKVMMNHTYTQRFATILKVAGIEVSKFHDFPTLVRRVANFEQAQTAWDILRQIDYPAKKKVLLISSSLPPLESTEIVQNFNANGVNVIDERLVLSREISLEEAFGYKAKILFETQESSQFSFEQFMELSAHSTYTEVPIRFGNASQRYKFESYGKIEDGLYSTESMFFALSAWNKNKKALLYSI